MKNNFKIIIINILRWTQKWTKTDMIYLTRNGFWLILQNFVLNSISLILTVVFANYLPKDDYGTYQYILSIFTILTLFSLYGLNTSTIKAVANGDEGTLFYSLKMKIKYGLIGLVSSIIVSIYYFTNHNQELGFAFLIASLFVPLYDSLYIYSAFLKGRQNFKKLSQYNIISNSVPIILLIITVTFSKNILIILFITLASTVAINTFLFFNCIGKLKPNNNKDNKSITFGKHLSLMGVLGSIAKQLDKMLIFHFLGPVNLAIYMIAIAPVKKIEAILLKINVLAFPKMSKVNIVDLKKIIPNKIKRLAPILILIVLTYIILAPYIYKIFLPKYVNSVVYSQIFVLILLFFPKSLLEQIFVVHSKKKQLYITNTIIPILKIIFFVIFIPIFKVLGVIFSLLLINFLHLIILTIFTNRIGYEKNNLKINI